MNIQFLGRFLLGASVMALVGLAYLRLTGESLYVCSSWSQYLFIVGFAGLIGGIFAGLRAMFNITSANKNKVIDSIMLPLVMVVSMVLANGAYKWWKGASDASVFIAQRRYKIKNH